MKTEFKVGMKFKNGSMKLEVLDYAEAKNTNVALLLCLSDGLFITVRNLTKWNSDYAWDWGRYFSEKKKAIKDFNTRKKDLL